VVGIGTLALTLLFQTTMLSGGGMMRRHTLALLIGMGALCASSTASADICRTFQPRYVLSLDAVPTSVGLCDGLPFTDVEGGQFDRYDRAIKMSRKTRITPVLFLEPPTESKAQQEWLAQHPKAAAQREKIAAAKGTRKWRMIRKVVNNHASDKLYVRNVVLTGDLLYFQDTAVARYVFLRLGLADFFDADTIYLRRGDTIDKLERRRGDYVFADGTRKGQKARFVIQDRAGLTWEDVEANLGWDMDRIRRRGGFRTARATGISATRANGVVTLPSGESLPFAAELEEDEIFVWVLAPTDRWDNLMKEMEGGRLDAEVARGITLAGDAMVDEKLRFDEPRTEEGQQDGALRHAWRAAYAGGRDTYSFNGDTYKVFLRDGRPNVPQVCVDFILDTVERYAGGWWAPKDQPRRYIRGRVDFSSLIQNRRQVRKLIRFARDNPEMVDLHSVPGPEQMPFAMRDAFYEGLRQLSPELLPGDVIIIYGLRDDGKNHWHSFQVYETDPMYGFPTSLIGNAGVARIQPWDDIMRSAPARSIRYRIRFRSDWLTQPGTPVSER
jgi:hypothetical protein